MKFFYSVICVLALCGCSAELAQSEAQHRFKALPIQKRMYVERMLEGGEVSTTRPSQLEVGMHCKINDQATMLKVTKSGETGNISCWSDGRRLFIHGVDTTKLEGKKSCYINEYAVMVTEFQPKAKYFVLEVLNTPDVEEIIRALD